MASNAENFPGRGKIAATARAEQTDSVAQQIISAEVRERELKTQKLRALRLAVPVAEPKKKATRRGK